MELAVALDTNRLSDLLRGDVALAERLGGYERVWLPLVVLGEIQAGFRGGVRGLENERLLRNALARPTVAILLPDEGTAEQYARLFVQLKRAGTPVPANDLWIAASVMQHRLRLITRDRHFTLIPHLLLG